MQKLSYTIHYALPNGSARTTNATIETDWAPDEMPGIDDHIVALAQITAERQRCEVISVQRADWHAREILHAEQAPATRHVRPRHEAPQPSACGTCALAPGCTSTPLKCTDAKVAQH